jgi:hypothetical protein
MQQEIRNNETLETDTGNIQHTFYNSLVTFLILALLLMKPVNHFFEGKTFNELRFIL